MIRELDQVVLTVDIPEEGLASGDVGTVVFDHHGQAYEVEFLALDGNTIAVVTLTASQVRPVAPDEVASARRIAGRFNSA